MPRRGYGGNGARENLPPKKFLKGQTSRGLRIPEEVFTLTVNGRYTQDTNAVSDSAIDIYMQPDVDTIRFVPWYHGADGAGDLRRVPSRRRAGADLRRATF